MPAAISIRLATPTDAPIVARHRAEMFKDMGDLPAEQYEPLLQAAQRELTDWLTAGTYVGWLATPADRPTEVVAGAGVQIRPLLPRPKPGHQAPRQGPEAIVLNVFTEKAWRRRGVARRLMEVIIAWSGDHGIARLVLHASPEGRRLYELLGFSATNEMHYSGEL